MLGAEPGHFSRPAARYRSRNTSSRGTASFAVTKPLRVGLVFGDPGGRLFARNLRGSSSHPATRGTLPRLPRRSHRTPGRLFSGSPQRRPIRPRPGRQATACLARHETARRQGSPTSLLQKTCCCGVSHNRATEGAQLPLVLVEPEILLRRASGYDGLIAAWVGYRCPSRGRKVRC